MELKSFRLSNRYNLNVANTLEDSQRVMEMSYVPTSDLRGSGNDYSSAGWLSLS